MLRPPTAAGATVEAPAGPLPAPAMSEPSEAPPVPGPDAESRAWVSALGRRSARREDASRRLHDLLLRAARFEINRRRGSHPHLRGGDLDDLAHQAADDAMLAILGKLDTYRGESRFTTWAYKFALLEAAVKLRRRAWQGREVPIEPEHWAVIAEPRRLTGGRGREQRGPRVDLDRRSRPSSRRTSARCSSRSRSTACRSTSSPSGCNTTRGALYKTIHDARKKLRSHLAEQGLRFEEDELEPRGMRS